MDSSESAASLAFLGALGSFLALAFLGFFSFSGSTASTGAAFEAATVASLIFGSSTGVVAQKGRRCGSPALVDVPVKEEPVAKKDMEACFGKDFAVIEETDVDDTDINDRDSWDRNEAAMGYMVQSVLHYYRIELTTIDRLWRQESREHPNEPIARNENL